MGQETSFQIVSVEWSDVLYSKYLDWRLENPTLVNTVGDDVLWHVYQAGAKGQDKVEKERKAKLLTGD